MLWFTSSSSVLPTSHVVYCINNIDELQYWWSSFIHCLCTSFVCFVFSIPFLVLLYFLNLLLFPTKIGLFYQPCQERKVHPLLHSCILKALKHTAHQCTRNRRSVRKCNALQTDTRNQQYTLMDKWVWIFRLMKRQYNKKSAMR